jgi:sigma54-dependent transcription regulator
MLFLDDRRHADGGADEAAAGCSRANTPPSAAARSNRGRIVAATNKDLRIPIQQGLFREDLSSGSTWSAAAAAAARRIEDVPD